MTESIVLIVCRECKVHPNEFFGSGRDRRLVRVRRIAIARLQAAGFNKLAIARLIKRDYSTVRYWLNPKLRQWKRGDMKARPPRTAEQRHQRRIRSQANSSQVVA